MSRVIRVIGQIDEDAFKSFSSQLQALETANNGKAVIIELSSDGGTAMDALAFAGRMRNSPCDIHVKAYGLVASAAVLVLAAGDHRMMGVESWVMVHEDSGRIKGDVATMEREAIHLRRLETQWANLLQSMTKAKAPKWTALHRATAYLNSDECLALGLIDEVI